MCCLLKSCKFWVPSLNLRVQRISTSLQSCFETFGDTGCSWLSILILKVQRTAMSFQSWFFNFEYAGGSQLGIGSLILIYIWSLIFDTPMIQILALYLDFEGAKNSHVLYSLTWGFWGWWRFLEGLVSTSWFGYGCCLWYTLWSKFLLSIMILYVQQTYMSSKSWFGALYGHLFFIHPWGRIFRTFFSELLIL